LKKPVGLVPPQVQTLSPAYRVLFRKTLGGLRSRCFFHPHQSFLPSKKVLIKKISMGRLLRKVPFHAGSKIVLIFVVRHQASPKRISVLHARINLFLAKILLKIVCCVCSELFNFSAPEENTVFTSQLKTPYYE
jgi:hypothetical protein